MTIYSSSELARLTGMSLRQIDYWDRTNLIHPSAQAAHGSGSRKRYSENDLLQVKVVARLVTAGVTIQAIRKVMAEIKEKDIDLEKVQFFIDDTGIVPH